MKTSFKDMHNPLCEKRAYRALSHGSRQGRSTTTFACPWCKAEVVAFVWSLCGGGKRCDCGAIFGGSGQGYRLTAEAAPRQSSTAAKRVAATPSPFIQGSVR